MSHCVASLRPGAAALVLVFLAGPTLAGQGRPPLPVEEQGPVKLAIDRGVAYLLASQNLLGSWGTGTAPGPGGGHLIGYTALPGLTLLECGIPADNSSVQKAAIIVRAAAPKIDATYELALSILFLDRLGEPRDEALIETFALKLIAGQRPSGGWSYRCPNLNTATQRQLLTVLRHLNPGAGLVLLPSELTLVKLTDQEPKGLGRLRMVDPGPVARAEVKRGRPEKDGAASAKGSDKAPPDLAKLKAKTHAPAEPPPDAGKKRPRVAIPPNLARLPVLQDPERLDGWADPKDDSDDPILGKTDNSNSQFALLALWAAQRHGVPTGRTMARVAPRYRGSQNADGGWGYTYARGGGAGSTPAMTCVGLIGLAVGHGLAHDDAPADAAKVQDPRLVKGFVALTRYLGDPAGRIANLPLPNLYFLWSVERVAVLYNLSKIGNKDWYRWGAESLVANQGADGSWDKGGYPGAQPILDSCLALLFLRRANLAADLTTRLPFNPEKLNTDIGKGLLGESAALHPTASPVARPEPPKPPVAPPSAAPDPSPAPVAKAPERPSAPPAPGPAQETESGGGKKWLFVVLGVCVLLLIGGGAALWLGRGPVAKEPDRKREKPRKKKRRARQDDDG